MDTIGCWILCSHRGLCLRVKSAAAFLYNSALYLSIASCDFPYMRSVVVLKTRMSELRSAPAISATGAPLSNIQRS